MFLNGTRQHLFEELCQKLIFVEKLEKMMKNSLKSPFF